MCVCECEFMCVCACVCERIGRQATILPVHSYVCVYLTQTLTHSHTHPALTSKKDKALTSKKDKRKRIRKNIGRY